MENKNHITYGLIGTGICVVLFLIQWFAKIPYDNPVFRWIPALIFAIVVILSCTNFSKINGGNVTFGQVFGNGFRTAAVITVLFALIYTVFYLLVPAYKESMIEFTRQQAVNSGNPEAAAPGIEFMEKYFFVSSMGGIVFIDLLIGVVASLIGAAIAKKKN